DGAVARLRGGGRLLPRRASRARATQYEVFRRDLQLSALRSTDDRLDRMELHGYGDNPSAAVHSSGAAIVRRHDQVGRRATVCRRVRQDRVWIVVLPQRL